MDADRAEYGADGRMVTDGHGANFDVQGNITCDINPEFEEAVLLRLRNPSWTTSPELLARLCDLCRRATERWNEDNRTGENPPSW